MTERDEHIARKRKEIEKIAKQQVKLITKAAAMVAKPSKYYKVNLRRIGKMLAIAMQVRALEMQKQMIIAQPIPRPIPNYVPGGIVPSGPAIVGEDGPELIISPKGIINVLPINKHFNKDQ